MNEPEHVWLCCDRLNGTAFVADDDKLRATQAVYQARVKRPVAFVVTDLVFLRRAFRQLVGHESRTFTRPEVASCAGVNPPVIHNWASAGLIRPSIRPRRGSGRGNVVVFAWHDAFVASVLAALARAGCDQRTMMEASKLLYGQRPAKKKEAKQALA